MKQFIQTFLFACAFGIAYFFVQYAIKAYNQNQELTEVLNTVENTVKNDPSEKRYDASSGLITKKLKDTKDRDERLTFAAGVFVGQYGRAVYGTKKYCKTLGVDVTEYSDSYKKIHRELYTRANSILNKNDSNVEELYKKIEKKIYPYIEKEVIEMKTMLIKQHNNNDITLVDACSTFNLIAQDKQLMEITSFSEVAPDAYKILME